MVLAVSDINYAELFALASVVTLLLLVLMAIKPPTLYMGFVLLVIGSVIHQSRTGKEKVDLDVSIKRVKVSLLGRSSTALVAGGLLLIAGSIVQSTITVARSDMKELETRVVEAKSTFVGAYIVPDRLVQFLKTTNEPPETPLLDEVLRKPPAE